MADNSKLLLFGGAAVAVWWFYFRTSATAVASPATAAPGTPAPVVPPGQPMPTGANTVEAIQAGTLLAAGAPAEGLPVDSWGWYVNQQLAPLGKAAPDPMPLFQTAVPGFARSQAVTAAQYWSVMGPALKSQLGLSGLGLYRWVQ